MAIKVFPIFSGMDLASEEANDISFYLNVMVEDGMVVTTNYTDKEFLECDIAILFISKYSSRDEDTYHYLELCEKNNIPYLVVNLIKEEVLDKWKRNTDMSLAIYDGLPLDKIEDTESMKKAEQVKRDLGAKLVENINKYFSTSLKKRISVINIVNVILAICIAVILILGRDIINKPLKDYEIEKDQIAQRSTVDYDMLEKSTVKISIYHKNNENGKFEPETSGSGFLISDDGYIITNHHVIDDLIDSESRVILIQLEEGSVVADLIEYDELSDLALLRSYLNTPSYLKLASENGNMGDKIYVCGFPRGNTKITLDGIISTDAREFSKEKRIEQGNTSGHTNGNSGGPVVNKEGALVGVTRASYKNQKAYDHGGFMIPVEELKEKLDDWGVEYELY